jgi:hypothetical protein
MSRLDQLTADRRAVLQLLVVQGKSYEEIAGLLRMSVEAVRERALNALDELGPEEAPGLTGDRQDEIADYLLGQQSASERAATRQFLEGSAAGRAWARIAASELRPLAGDALPEIPAEGAEVDEAFDALQARTVAREQRERSSKLGGVLLLVGLGVAIAVVLVLVLSSGGDNNKDTGTIGSTTPSTSTAPSTSTNPQVEAQINLTSPQRGSRALGVATVASVQGQRAITLVAQGLQPSGTRFAYAVWLYNSPTSAERLGFTRPVGKDGRLTALAPYPSDISRFGALILTRETQRNPSQPGAIVLRGALR